MLIAIHLFGRINPDVRNEILKNQKLNVSERYQIAKYCKVLQILVQSSLSLIFDFVRTQSVRQDSNLRPSAPKELDRQNATDTTRTK